MSNAVWPVTRGLSWSVFKTPSFSTLLLQALSGKETRLALWQSPVWEFRLAYEFLFNDPDGIRYPIDPLLGYTDLQTIMGFFCSRLGSFDSFLFQDPIDFEVRGQVLTVDVGSTTRYQCVRNLGGFLEPIQNLAGVQSVYLNGIRQAASAYSVDASGGINFVAPPGGAVVSADFDFYFRVRFGSIAGSSQQKDGDSLEFENFMNQLWTMKEVTFVSAKQ